LETITAGDVRRRDLTYFKVEFHIRRGKVAEIFIYIPFRCLEVQQNKSIFNLTNAVLDIRYENHEKKKNLAE